MNAMTRLISSASLSRFVIVTVLILLSCLSAAASDGRSCAGAGDGAHSCGPDVTRGSADSGSKSETRDAATPGADASSILLGNTAMLRDQNGIAAREAPLTVKEKFNYFLTRSFLRPTPYATAIAAGAFGEWIDDDHHHHSKPGDFAADSMTRAARSFAFGTSANFFEKFAYASLFKQDPRYHKSEKTGAGARIAYAVIRLFVTQNDQGARQFNVSFIAGGLTTAGLSNVWERDERRTAADTMKRWGIHVGVAAATNILHEFIGKK